MTLSSIANDLNIKPIIHLHQKRQDDDSLIKISQTIQDCLNIGDGCQYYFVTYPYILFFSVDKIRVNFEAFLG